MRPEDRIISEFLIMTVQETLRNIKEGLEAGSITDEVFPKVEKYLDGLLLIIEVVED